MAVLEAPAPAEPVPAVNPDSDAKPYRWRWAALLAIMCGNAMELLDSSVTNVAGPTMRADLGGGPGVIQWLTAAYTLAMVAGLLTGGRLGDIIGRKQMFLIGAAGFTVGSLLVAIAQSSELVIGARVLQGLFGAAMIPQVMGLIKEMFPPKELPSAFGLFGPVMGIAAIGGPILAGWLVAADLWGTGWRMIFLINLPIGIAVIAAAVKFLPKSRTDKAVKLDVPGAVLASVAGVLMIYPLVQGRESGWPLWSFAMLAGSVAVFAVFGWYEARKGRRDGHPLVLPSLFGKRAFKGGLVLGMLLFASMAGFGLVVNLYIQVGLGFTPLEASFTMVPFAVAMGGAMGFLPKLKRFGRKVLLAGALINAIGVIALAATFTIAGAQLHGWHLVAGMIVTGIGAALFMGPFFDSVLSGVDSSEIGSASGTLTAVQQLGAAFGVAVLGTIFFSGLGPDPASLTAAVQVVSAVIVAMLVAAFAVGFTLPAHTDSDDLGSDRPRCPPTAALSPIEDTTWLPTTPAPGSACGRSTAPAWSGNGCCRRVTRAHLRRWSTWSGCRPRPATHPTTSCGAG